MKYASSVQVRNLIYARSTLLFPCKWVFLSSQTLEPIMSTILMVKGHEHEHETKYTWNELLIQRSSTKKSFVL